MRFWVHPDRTVRRLVAVMADRIEHLVVPAGPGALREAIPGFRRAPSWSISTAASERSVAWTRDAPSPPSRSGAIAKLVARRLAQERSTRPGRAAVAMSLTMRASGSRRIAPGP